MKPITPIKNSSIFASQPRNLRPAAPNHAVLRRASPFLLLAHRLRAAARHYYSGCPSLSTLISPGSRLRCGTASVAQEHLKMSSYPRPPTRTAASAPPRCSAPLGSHSRSPRVVVEEERHILVAFGCRRELTVVGHA